MKYDARHITEVCLVLKKRFPNLTTAETLKLGGEIVAALERIEDA